jgi:formate dehydrogenase
LFDPLPGTLPEYEIHARLCRALGAYNDDDLAPLHDAAARGRATYADAFINLGIARPEFGRLAAVLLYETLGPTLTGTDGDPAAGAAALWGLAQRCALTFPDSIRRAGIGDDGAPLGEALFEAILSSPHGVTFTVDEYDETMRRLETSDGKVSLAIPTLLAELATLGHAPHSADSAFPLVLSAGERRSSTANTIQRDPGWRKKDQQGALRVSLDDAARLGLTDGDRARITTKRGSAVATVEVTDTLLAGHITLPNGFGLGPSGSSDAVGVAPNELTASDDRDWFAGTPHHKHVPARLEKVGA